MLEEVRAQVAGVSSLLLYGSWGLNLGLQSWRQEPLLNDPSHWLSEEYFEGVLSSLPGA